MNFLSFFFGRRPKSETSSLAARPVAPTPTRSSEAAINEGRWTDAQLKFLATFLRGGECPKDEGSYWTKVLGQSPSRSAQRLTGAGLLESASTAAKLDSAFKATEIKVMLRERGLPVSGKKADGIDRLVTADPSGMDTKVAQISAYMCTETGRTLAEHYVNREAERKRSARARSLEFLCAGKLRQAAVIAAEYEASQVFPRGLGVDWNQRPSPEDVQKLERILEARPTILKEVAVDEWAPLQRAAAMMELWGERSGREWLPEGFVGASNLDVDTAIRMVLFAGDHQAKLEQYRNSGCARVEVSGCGEDSCPVCKKMNGKKYRVNQVPELPHPECTHEMGCRCMLLPVID